MSNKLNLTESEQKKINTICDYLFFDQFSEILTFLRFERCFQPLFSEDKNFDVEEIFKELCGPKKKYLNYKRFVSSYLKYKDNKVSKGLKDFFDKLFNSILKEEHIGEFGEGKLTYSTRKANKNRESITRIEVLNDKEGVLHGFIIEFDEFFENKLYPKKLENNLSTGLEISLKILNEKKLERKNISKYIQARYFRDAVTHVFGTVDEKTKFVTFLGFKCISGKTQFIGTPKGASFLIGEFGKIMNQFKCQMTSEGINVILPYFDTNYRPNVYLTKKISEITLEDLNKDEIILDESYLAKLKDKEEIDKYITTTLIDDAHFFNYDLKDEIFGNSLKEVIKKQPKRWMRNRMERERMIPRPRRFFSLNDFLLKFDEEYRRRRGRFFMEPRFGLLDRRRMHRRRRLHHFGFGFPPFPGDFPRHLSPFGPRPPFPDHEPMPPSMRHFSNPPFGPHHPHMLPPSPYFGPHHPPAIISHPPHYPNIARPPHHLGPHHPQYMTPPRFPHGPVPVFESPYHPYLESPYYSRTNYPYIPDSPIYRPPLSLEQRQFGLTRANIRNISSRGQIGNTNSNISRARGGQKNILKKPIEYERYNINYQIYEPEYYDDNYYYQQEYDDYGDYEYYGDDTLYYNDYQNEEVRYTPNIKIKSNIPMKYLRKDILQSYYTPYITIPSRPKPKTLKQETKEIEEQLQAQYEKQKEKEEIQAQYEQKQETEAQIQAQYNLMEEEMQKQNEQIKEEQGEIKGEQNKESKEKEDDEEEDILIPDEHPEETTSLEELDHQLDSLKKLLEDKNLKEEERKKLLKLQQLYTQQKNILLDNVEKKEKDEILKKGDIKLDEYINKEKEKREKEEKYIDELIESEIEKKADKTEAKIISIADVNPSKTFRKQEIYKGNKPWTDPMFLPCKENLCPFNEKGWVLPENVLFTDVMGWEKYNWSRVEDILNSKNYQVFEDGISPDDIIQGSIGDCYFLSAIGSLSKFSRYIDRLFLTKERTKEHLYGVFIFLNACWKLVCIDDYLPYTGKKFKKFAFSSSGGKELWVAFLEKAWAKINGNYAKIGCGGSPTEVFDVLTEAYTEQVPINPYYSDYIWETMINAENKGYIMTAGTSSDIVNLNLDDVGLSAGHAYTVLGVLEIDTGKGVEKVVRLRNPYGNGEFNGDWSDYSSKWTPELKKKYNLVIKDDGDFYMGFNDFTNYYITLGICKLHPGYKTTTLKVKNPTQCQITKVTVEKGEVHSFLQLYQKNPRIPLKDGTKPKLVYCFLMLLDKNFNYIYSVSNANMHNGIEQTLKEGTYYLVSDVNYRYCNPNKKNYSYVLTCYSQTELNLENVTSQFDVVNVLQTAIYSYCRTYVPPTKCSNGVYLYRGATNMDSIPFETAIFENYTENNYKVKLNVVGKGEKSFCFYADEIASEYDTTTVKELPKHSVAIFNILKYSLSSIFNFQYYFAPLKSPNPNNPTVLRTPKIYDEKPVIQEGQPTTDINAQQTQGQNIQQNTKNIESNKKSSDGKKASNEKILPKKDNIKITTQKEIITNNKNDKLNQPKTENEEKASVNKKVKKKGHPVFNTEPIILDENGVLAQYYMDNGENIIIGLENRSSTKMKMQLIIEGASIINTGSTYAVFYSNPRERKIFKLKKNEGFTGDINFQFQLA